jgi:hypothetical protein
MASSHVFNEMSSLNITVVRLGPGKYLQGRVLMNGVVRPEVFSLIAFSFIIDLTSVLPVGLLP